MTEQFYFGTGDLLPIFQDFENSFLDFLHKLKEYNGGQESVLLFITWQISIIDVKFELLPWQSTSKKIIELNYSRDENFSNDRSVFSYARGGFNIDYQFTPTVEVFIPEVLKGSFPIHFSANEVWHDSSVKCFEKSSELFLSIGTHQHFGYADKLYVYWKAPHINTAARYCDYLPPNGFVGYLTEYNFSSNPKKLKKIINITFGQAFYPKPTIK